MMSTPTLTSPEPATHDPIVWTVHPARERPGATGFAVGVIVAMGWLTFDMMQCLDWAAFSVAFLLVVLHRFFLPGEYRVDAEGISVRTLWRRRQYRWRDVRRLLYDDRGAYLSTRRRASLLDSLRGMHLLFGKSLTDERRRTVVARIRSQIHREDPQC